MLQSIPQLANILLLILLVYSMFAVVFVSSYGTVKYGYRLGPTLNFENFGDAIFACYQVHSKPLILMDCMLPLKIETFLATRGT